MYIYEKICHIYIMVKENIMIWLVGLKIEQLLYEPDEVYKSTDGHGGNAYKVVLSNKETLCFRHFHSVVEKFGGLQVLEQNNQSK